MKFHGFYVLSTEPLIVSYTASSKFYTSLANEIQKSDSTTSKNSLPSWFRPHYVLEHIGGWSAPWHRMGRFKTKQVMHGLVGRSHHLFVNAKDENTVRQYCLIRGAQFSVSIYINEHLFNVTDKPKVYDAIYTAQLMAFKRHELAQKIEKLMVISYGDDLHAYCPLLKHADFNRSFLSQHEVVEKYNQSYAGLCLSAVEGAMLAACEYLLCGIPIISTPSKGGRDEFFDQENTLIVPPEAEAVAQAAHYWKKHAPDPYAIRERTLNRINHMRQKYCTYIAALIKKGGGDKIHPEKLMQIYFGKPDGMLTRFVKLESLNKINLDDFKLTN